jgi:hypothetical protein
LAMPVQPRVVLMVVILVIPKGGLEPREGLGPQLAQGPRIKLSPK